MIEDKLTKEERIRLEALAQTNARFTMAGSMFNVHEAFWNTVAEFERYILTGNPAEQKKH